MYHTMLLDMLSNIFPLLPTPLKHNLYNAQKLENGNLHEYERSEKNRTVEDTKIHIKKIISGCSNVTNCQRDRERKKRLHKNTHSIFHEDIIENVICLAGTW